MGDGLLTCYDNTLEWQEKALWATKNGVCLLRARCCSQGRRKG
ncbi:MAG: hypothetical protein RQM92_06215 [Candidatus Syntrophopropionicum ammoniitolerans]